VTVSANERCSEEWQPCRLSCLQTARNCLESEPRWRSASNLLVENVNARSCRRIRTFLRLVYRSDCRFQLPSKRRWHTCPFEHSGRRTFRYLQSPDRLGLGRNGERTRSDLRVRSNQRAEPGVIKCWTSQVKACKGCVGLEDQRDFVLRESELPTARAAQGQSLERGDGKTGIDVFPLYRKQ
jgi:hypothetical protein